MRAANSPPVLPTRFTCAVALASLILIASTDVEGADLTNCTLTQPPTAPVELIKNIQCAVSKDILSDDDIFTDDEKVWNIFAAQQFHKNYPYSKTLKTLGLSYFPNALDAANLQALPLWQRLSIDVRKNLKAYAPYKSEVWIRIENATGLQLHFTNILKLFGPKWTPVEDLGVSSGEISSRPQLSIPNTPITATHSHGTIQYMLQTPPSIKAGAIARFSADDTLVTLDIFIGKK